MNTLKNLLIGAVLGAIGFFAIEPLLRYMAGI